MFNKNKSMSNCRTYLYSRNSLSNASKDKSKNNSSKLIMNFLKVCPPKLKVKHLYDQYPTEKIKRVRFVRGYTTGSGSPGSSAGKGGGAGGSVKEAGGGLGKMASAHEEGFFYDQQQEQIKKMKQKLKAEAKKEPQKSEK